MELKDRRKRVRQLHMYSLSNMHLAPEADLGFSERVEDRRRDPHVRSQSFKSAKLNVTSEDTTAEIQRRARCSPASVKIYFNLKLICKQ